MKIAVASTGSTLEARVDPRFGRARCFLIVDTETGGFAVLDNAPNLNAGQGAGIQAGSLVAEAGVEAVVTGHVGPKAMAVLAAGHVAVYLCATGTVAEALEQFRAGQLELAESANVRGHWA